MRQAQRKSFTDVWRITFTERRDDNNLTLTADRCVFIYFRYPRSHLSYITWKILWHPPQTPPTLNRSPCIMVPLVTYARLILPAVTLQSCQGKRMRITASMLVNSCDRCWLFEILLTLTANHVTLTRLHPWKSWWQFRIKWVRPKSHRLWGSSVATWQVPVVRGELGTPWPIEGGYLKLMGTSLVKPRSDRPRDWPVIGSPVGKQHRVIDLLTSMLP